jgi:hypothetical protein
MADPTDTLALFHSLKQQIDTLTEQQIDALQQATYLGMTPDEAKDYDERRRQITGLIRELEELQKAQ